MKNVDPIRDISKIEEIKNNIEKSWNIRNLLLFVAWINYALRISDLWKLKISDVFEWWKIKNYFEIKDKKTSKRNRIFIAPNVKDVLNKFILKYPHIAINPDSYLLFSQDWKKPLCRRQAQNIIKNFTQQAWLDWNYCTHSLRKTWAYQARKKWVGLDIIQAKLNHSNMRETIRYLWITQDELYEATLMVNL